MTEPRTSAARSEPATQDVRMLQLVDVVCGIERELVLQLLSVIYSDESALEDENEAQTAS